MPKETETNEYPKRPKLFKGKIKSLSIGNYPCFFTTEPKYGEDLEQRVTITVDGHLKVYRKIYEGGWLQSVKAENVTKSKKISVEDTMKIFNRISRYFSKDYDSCVACDGGSWELRLTNTEGEVFRYWGGTTGIDHRSSLSRLSKLIRKVTGLEYVLGFDEDTQYGFLLLNKIDKDPADVIELVKKVARKNDFNVVEYLGQYDGARVYNPIFKELLDTGMPQFILVKDGKAWLEISEYCLDIIDAFFKDKKEN